VLVADDVRDDIEKFDEDLVLDVREFFVVSLPVGKALILDARIDVDEGPKLDVEDNLVLDDIDVREVDEASAGSVEDVFRALVVVVRGTILNVREVDDAMLDVKEGFGENRLPDADEVVARREAVDRDVVDLEEVPDELVEDMLLKDVEDAEELLDSVCEMFVVTSYNCRKFLWPQYSEELPEQRLLQLEFAAKDALGRVTLPHQQVLASSIPAKILSFFQQACAQLETDMLAEPPGILWVRLYFSVLF
jgi:hypothetical protein